MKKYYYVRVSTVGQKIDRQMNELGISHDTPNLYFDKQSGKDLHRPAFTKLMEDIKKDTDKDITLYVHSMDRLSRSLRDLNKVVETLCNLGITLIFTSGALANTPISNNNNTPVGKLMLNIFGAFSEFEREQIRERQQQGIKKWKESDKFIKGVKRDTYFKYNDVIKSMNINNLTLQDSLKLHDMSKPTYYRVKRTVEEYDKNNEE